MTREAPPKLLVVSSPDDREELVATLRQRGFDEIHTGDGGDETLARARALKPEVMVLCADLEHGDARSLASALRRDPRPPGIVLVGQEHGPVRTALDAAAFEVDQFVTRPLSPKALAFAVSQCARVVAGRAEAENDPIDRATDVAIDVVFREAVASLLAVPELAPTGSEEPTQPYPAEGAPSAPLPVLRGPDEITADHGPAEPVVEPPRAVGVGDDLPTWREPTVILQADKPRAEATPAEDSAEPGGDEPARIGLAELAAYDPAGSDPGDPEALELDRELEDLDLDDDAIAAKEGGFAGELRRKMSQMAERLFGAQRIDTGPSVDLGLAHGAHTEIDLAKLGVDTVVGQADDANLIGGEHHPPATFPDAETHIASAAGSEVGAGSTPGTGPSASEIPVRGELGPAGGDVATILAERCRASFTGHVVFRRQTMEKVVHFVEGRPVFASSNVPHDRMGELLCREGKITREQHARCRDAVLETGRRMGEILVEMGCLKRRELLPAVRRHVEDIIYSLFAWEEGEYAVVSEDHVADEKIRLSRHPAALLLEGVRRKYSWAVLEEHLGTPDAIIVTGARARVDEVLASADLSAAERAFVTSLDGDRTLGEAAAEKSLELLLAYQLAFGLVALGAAQILHKGGDSRADLDTARAPSLVGETDLAIDRQRVLVKRALVDEADYFTLLGVRRDATRFEIRRAYEAARKEYAAGSFPAEVREELGGDIEEINQLLDEALSVLDDDDLRAAYLANLRD
jgi:CheY-like chemotaxis protein